MNLGFMMQFPGTHRHLKNQKTYFPEKILLCIQEEKLAGDDFKAREWVTKYWDKFGDKLGSKLTDMDDIAPKKHTIRSDVYDRWKAGNNIHFVVGNQTKHRFQFAPVIQCKSVQKIEIVYWMGCGGFPAVVVNERSLSHDEIEQLAINDGFPSSKEFFQWFNTDFKGTLIHWTNLKY
jgi:hypothetical protein